MNNLDSLNLPKNDQFGMYHDLMSFGQIFLEGYQAMAQMPIPSHYIKCKKVTIIGMGGSGIAGSLSKGLVNQFSRLPIEVVSNSQLPNYVDNETLLIAVSYSGNTEETIEGFINGFKRGARLIAMGTGGQLEDLARKYQTPYYRHQATTCGQPRTASPRHLGAITSILKRFGLLEHSDKQILAIKNLLENSILEWSAATPTNKNLAKRLALASFDRIPIIWGADHFEQVAHRFKADFNENSKSLSYFEFLPEMNHKSLAGSDFPKPLIKNIFHIFLQSKFNCLENQLRVKITADFFKKRKFQVEILEFPTAKNPLDEILLAINLSGFISFYLAILYGIDPTPVEAVQEFKKKLHNETIRKVK